MQKFRYLKDVVSLQLEQSACIGCGRCAEVCPHQVFAVAQKRAAIVDRDACIECGACAVNCPVKVIAVNAGVGCATGLINEWFRAHWPGGVGGGCCS